METDAIVARYVSTDEAYLPGLGPRDVTLAEINAAGYTLVDVLASTAYGRSLYAPADEPVSEIQPMEPVSAPRSARRSAKAATGSGEA